MNPRWRVHSFVVDFGFIFQQTGQPALIGYGELRLGESSSTGEKYRDMCSPKGTWLWQILPGPLTESTTSSASDSSSLIHIHSLEFLLPLQYSLHLECCYFWLSHCPFRLKILKTSPALVFTLGFPFSTQPCALWGLLSRLSWTHSCKNSKNQVATHKQIVQELKADAHVAL